MALLSYLLNKQVLEAATLLGWSFQPMLNSLKQPSLISRSSLIYYIELFVGWSNREACQRIVSHLRGRSFILKARRNREQRTQRHRNEECLKHCLAFMVLKHSATTLSNLPPNSSLNSCISTIQINSYFLFSWSATKHWVNEMAGEFRCR